MPAHPSLSSLVPLFGVALLLRLAFVAWAPGVPTGDGLFYHQLALDLKLGNGYVNFDRSPANTWGPGWPGALAALHLCFGDGARVGMWANALAGAATALLLVRLGHLLAGARVALVGGWLYALWPSMIYFSATLHREPFFNLLLVTTLIAVVEAGRPTRIGRQPFAWAAGVGVLVGFGTLVRDESLLLLAPFALYWLVARRPSRATAAMIGLAFVLSLVVVAPWTLRNYRAFDRFILTSAGSGMVLHAANHPGASGGNDLRAILDYIVELGVADETQAEQNLAMYDDAPGRVARYVRDEPAEVSALLLHKLWLTYGSDASSADLVRGFFGPARWHLDATTWQRLAMVANVWWWGLAPFIVLGLFAARTWRSDALVLLAGLQLVYSTLHLVFVASARAHTSEVLWLALLAAAGLLMLNDRWRGRARG